MEVPELLGGAALGVSVAGLVFPAPGFVVAVLSDDGPMLPVPWGDPESEGCPGVESDVGFWGLDPEDCELGGSSTGWLSDGVPDLDEGFVSTGCPSVGFGRAVFEGSLFDGAAVVVVST